MTRLILISDTHGHAQGMTVPKGDILIHAGDLSLGGDYDEVIREMDWLARLPHRRKVFIAGNHDFIFEKDLRFQLDGNPRDHAQMCGLTYLQDRAVTIEGLRIYGSPWQPWFHDWAFNAHRGSDIQQHWDKIPSGIDVLVTHGPPAGWGGTNTFSEDVGCANLTRTVIERVKPKLHVFGHIHEGYGDWHHPVLPIRFINASVLDVMYRQVNAPVVVDL